jgi:hypothetical protein
MKRIWLFGLAMLCMVALASCSNKKTSKAEADNDDDEELVEADDKTPSDCGLENDIAELENEGVPDIYDDNVVWTSLGGTYMFTDGNQSAILDVDLDDDTSGKLIFGDDEYRAVIDTMSGEILGLDDKDEVAFQGFVYSGGNLLKGKLRGKDVVFGGACGL